MFLNNLRDIGFNSINLPLFIPFRVRYNANILAIKANTINKFIKIIYSSLSRASFNRSINSSIQSSRLGFTEAKL